MTTGTAAAPGWYSDPTGRHGFRHWDGRTWTASVPDGGITGSDALETAPGTPAPQAPEAVPPPAVPPPAAERVSGGEQQVEASGEPPAAPAGRRSRTLLRGRAGGAVAALAVLSALLVIAASSCALLAHRGVLAGTGTAKTAAADLSAGLGPTLCLAAGAVAALLVVVEWPWRVAPNVLGLRDGSVRPQPPL